MHLPCWLLCLLASGAVCRRQTTYFSASDSETHLVARIRASMHFISFPAARRRQTGRLTYLSDLFTIPFASGRSAPSFLCVCPHTRRLCAVVRCVNVRAVCVRVRVRAERPRHARTRTPCSLWPRSFVRPFALARGSAPSLPPSLACVRACSSVFPSPVPFFFSSSSLFAFCGCLCA